MHGTAGVLASVLLLGGVPVPTAVAQFRNPPTRPRLPPGADTNSARAYYDHGVTVLNRDPWTAAAAFYWASRLDPSWPETFYARRVAGLLAQDHLLMGYLEGVEQVVDSREFRQLDSLAYHAQQLNPFYRRHLDEQMYTGYFLARYKRDRRMAASRRLDPGEEEELRFYVERYLKTGTNLFLRAAVAASRGSFGEALDVYRRLLSQSPVKAVIHTERARIFYAIAAYDSALAELHTALSELRQLDTASLMPVYVSREQFEHAIGMIHEAAGDPAAAREAYGRALTENLSYAPAHVRLGALDLVEADTANALSEWDLAVEVARRKRRHGRPWGCCSRRPAGWRRRWCTCAAPPTSNRPTRLRITCWRSSRSARAFAKRRWRPIGRFSRGPARATRCAPP